MYIQITTNCNMSCAHCGFSCSPRKKDFMTMDAFEATMSFVYEYGMSVSIGGGEPTCHPRFWDMLYCAISEVEEDSVVWLATNGKKTKDALRLARLAARGVISCDLSQDIYHEPIDPVVVRAFSGKERTSGLSIRNTSRHGDVIYAGRSKKIAGARKDICICSDLFVDPFGDVYSCGCKKHRFGNVLKPGLNMGEIDEWFELRNASSGDCVFR